MPFRNRSGYPRSHAELESLEREHLADLEAERRSRGRMGLLDRDLNARIERQRGALDRVERNRY